MDDPKTEKFVRLLMANESRLFGYAFALLLNADDAREMMQDAAVTMWQHFDEYDPELPFFPWASRFAYFSALTFRKSRMPAKARLTDEAIDAVVADYTARKDELDPRGEALTHCIAQLPAPARTLLKHRYQEGKTVNEIAKRTGRSANALYKALERIRIWLLDCIRRQMAGGQA